jgi:hypothetical protein
VSTATTVYRRHMVRTIICAPRRSINGVTWCTRAFRPVVGWVGRRTQQRSLRDRGVSRTDARLTHQQSGKGPKCFTIELFQFVGSQLSQSGPADRRFLLRLVGLMLHDSLNTGNDKTIGSAFNALATTIESARSGNDNWIGSCGLPRRQRQTNRP